MRWEKDASSPFFGGANRLEAVEKQARVLQLINAYRVRGHLVADVNPLGVDAVPYHPDLDPATYGFTLWDLDRPFITNGLAGRDHATLREILEVLRQTYCGKIGAEFMYNQDTAQKTWLIERMEGSRNRANLSREDRRRILNALVKAEAFEKFLHTKYVGQKRFSLEGGEAAIALLDRLLDRAAEADLGEAVIGMSHRGRLTVLVNTVGKPAGQIFAEFEGQVDPGTVQGSGDVKYHLGAVGTHTAPSGQKLGVSLAPNPSHLEFVDPVVEGMVRAKQTALGDHREHAKVLPILLHGDAAFAGQGIVAETLNMSQLHGYRTGGTVHVVVNNQIGFTTNPADARSSPYCTDVAKMVQAPVFHVNGDDPEAVVHAVDVAMRVPQHVPARRRDRHGLLPPVRPQRGRRAELHAAPHVREDQGAHVGRAPLRRRARQAGRLLAGRGGPDVGRGEDGARPRLRRGARRREVRVRLADGRARETSQAEGHGARAARARSPRAVSAVPEGFEVHPKLKPILKKRSEYASGRPEIDWSGGEMLAFGMLLLDGTPVRLSGQDSGRGTFSQRHAVLADAATGAEWTPLNTIAPEQAAFEVIDSLLSENAVMGFEFGYAVADPSTLVLWEGQFGDFANGAQVIIDQFISGSEQKWNQRCGLVLLLPHGQEGQGPEHSSARLERFLTLCAEDNMRVANVSTPAQYYHLLLRQMAGDVRKPLVVMTPKSLLRHPKVVSTIDELADGAFHPVLDDPAGPSRARRVILASGKVAWDLIAAREKADRTDVAIVRLEQYYPFPGREIGAVLQRYPQDAELVCVQEEPRNMGAWRFVREQFLDGKVEGLAARPDAPLHRKARAREPRARLAPRVRARAGGAHRRGPARRRPGDGGGLRGPGGPYFRA